jgi:phospholipase/carboxylesterase
MSRPVIVALHGVGASARDLAAALAPLEQLGDVIALEGTEPFDGGGPGRQWFSVAGVTDGNRASRTLAALPPLLDRLDRLALRYGIAREDLVLFGFSQGAIMALTMVAQGLHPGRAISVAGRLPEAVPVQPAGDRPATLLMAHDLADDFMPPRLSDDAGTRLATAGHHVDQVRTSGISHGIGPATIDAVADWLAAIAPFRADVTQLEG